MVSLETFLNGTKIGRSRFNPMPRSRKTNTHQEVLAHLSDVIGDYHHLLSHGFGEADSEIPVDIDLCRIKALTTDLNHQLKTKLTDVSAANIPGVKKRKASQITLFERHIRADGTQHIHDWCCGKGHLGRLISTSTNSNRTGYDNNPVLLREAARLDQPMNQRARYREVDALSCQIQVEPRDHFISLHACGGLHRALIQQFLIQRAGNLSVSPCCYHKFLGEPYQAYSKIGQRTHPVITENLLKFATRERVTGSKNEERHRETLRAYRLGFDSWVRDSLGRTAHTSVPSTPYSIANAGFNAFCRWAAKLRAPELQSMDVPSKYLATGLARLKHEVRFEMQVSPLRPLVEAWLVFDMAAAFEEQDFEVSVVKFCDYTVTPRNFLLRANFRD